MRRGDAYLLIGYMVAQETDGCDGLDWIRFYLHIRRSFMMHVRVLDAGGIVGWPQSVRQDTKEFPAPFACLNDDGIGMISDD